MVPVDQLIQALIEGSRKVKCLPFNNEGNTRVTISMDV